MKMRILTAAALILLTSVPAFAQTPSGLGTEACISEAHYFENSTDQQARSNLINEIFLYISPEEQEAILADPQRLFDYETGNQPILTVDANGQHYFLGMPITMAVDPATLSTGGSGGTGSGTLPDIEPFSCTAQNTTRVVNVANENELRNALSNAQCGDEIVVGAGNYSGDFNVTGNCSADAPIVVRGATANSAVFSNSMRINGNHLHVMNLAFDGGTRPISINGDSNKLIGNSFVNYHNNAINMNLSTNTEVAYNDIGRQGDWTAEEMDPDCWHAGSGCIAINMGIRSGHRDENFSESTWLHHNYFHDMIGRPGGQDIYHSGQSDAIEVCATGTDRASNWLIENNLIVNHEGGHGIVDIKCAEGTTLRNNTILDSPGGRMDLRGGSGATMIGNYIANSGGSSIGGGDHVIQGNVVTGSGLFALVTGDAAPEDAGQTDNQTATRVLMEGNQGRLTVGEYDRLLPAQDNVIRGHNGPITLGSQINTTVDNNPVSGIPLATPLNASQVGLSALQQVCAGGPT